jgi:hypothetical protein
MAMQNTLSAVSQATEAERGVEFDDQVRRELHDGERNDEGHEHPLLTVAIAPERSMSAKVRSMAIRPGRDSPTIGTNDSHEHQKCEEEA